MRNRFCSFLLLLLAAVTLHAQDAQPSQAAIVCEPSKADSADVSLSSSADTLQTAELSGLSLQDRLDKMVGEALFETTQLGLMVWDLDADSCIYRHHELQRMRPASTQKTVTAIAALDLLGSGYQFKTELRYAGVIEEQKPSVSSENADSTTVEEAPAATSAGAVLRGSLYLIGGMDPLLDESDIRAMAAAVRELGITTITGNIYEDCTFKDGDKWGEGWCWDDDNPDLYPLLVNGKRVAASRLMAALRDAGITVEGGVGEASCPSGAIRVTERSHAIGEVLTPMMKNSDNWYAESMFYQIAHQQGGKGAGVKAASRYIDRLVTRAGADQKLMHVADGSGLSLYNYVTPDMEVKLLRYAWKMPEIIEIFHESLPVAGVDGTLKSRMKGTKAHGNVYAKTGTVTGVSSLAGYCTAANGHRLCFSIINQGIIKAKYGRDFQDRLCVELCR